MKSIKVFVLIIFLLSMGLPVFSHSEDHSNEEAIHATDTDDHEIKIDHIHGMDFQNKDLIVATHRGLLLFDGKEWIKINAPAHDYMGFSMTESGFFASGHPDPSTSIKNPLGIIWSDDLGKHLNPVAFYGELDFHWLSVGYNTLNMYAYTSGSTSTTPAGFYHSLDKGKTWHRSALQGIGGKLITFIAHPVIPGAIFISTSAGVFLSTNKADNSALMMKELEPGAITITRDGQYLLSGTKKLTILEISKRKLTEIKIPDLQNNEILTNIAILPEGYNTIVINTSFLNMYITRNRGKNWDQIITSGVIEN